MFLLKKVLASLVLPPAGLLLLAAAGLLLMRRDRRVGAGLAAFSLTLLLALSLPVTGFHLLRSLEHLPPATPARLQSVQAIVVLGGGSYYAAPEYGGDTVNRYTLERVRYAARLQRQSQLPVLLTGGSPFGGRPEALSMQAVLEEMGGSARWIEPDSRDTRENAQLSAVLLRAAGINRIALVSHAWHLPRAVAWFEAAGFKVLPAPLGYTTLSPSTIARWMPSAEAFDDSAIGIRERLSRLAGH